MTTFIPSFSQVLLAVQSCYVQQLPAMHTHYRWLAADKKIPRSKTRRRRRRGRLLCIIASSSIIILPSSFLKMGYYYSLAMQPLLIFWRQSSSSGSVNRPVVSASSVKTLSRLPRSYCWLLLLLLLLLSLLLNKK
jgi:hypothetical protein